MTSSVRAAPRTVPGLRTGVATVATVAALAGLAVLGLAGCAGPDHVEGTVVAVRPGKDDRPLGGGWVAVLGDDALLDFLARAGIDVPGRTDLPYATGRVLHDDVTRSGGTLARIDSEGRFALRVTGRQTVCRLVEAPQVDLLKGCAVVDLPAKGTLELTVGDTGLHATPDD